MGTYKIKIEGKIYSVTVKGIHGGSADVEVDGKGYSVEIEGRSSVQAGVPAAVPETQARTEPASTTAPQNRNAIKAPLPGVILNVSASAGQNVRKGDKIAVLEAMKMENDILAPRDGKIAALKVNPGDSVLEGAVIAELE